MIPLKEEAQRSIDLREESMEAFAMAMNNAKPGETLTKPIALQGILRDRSLAAETYYTWVRNSDNVSLADLSPDNR